MVNVIVDNTVIANFALARCEDVLKKVFSSLSITGEVLQEFQRGEETGVLPGRDWSWIEVLEIESGQERIMFERLSERLGRGESSCLSLAANRKMKFLTDDMDARKYAQMIGVPVSGTIGVLLIAVNKEILTLEEGNRLLLEMIEKGYYSPYRLLDSLL